LILESGPDYGTQIELLNKESIKKIKKIFLKLNK